MREDGAFFYVNFTDYLDTGLFIDHRNMRKLIKETSQGKSVLNLFAYTCSASVQAALGGAKSVTSVDLSANYLEWGRANFLLNGCYLSDDEDARYRFIDADTFEWLKNHTDKYDVIFIDPPTFSNSKKFYGTFDVQRDHVALINRAMNRLNAGGVLFFSNNFTKFVLDDELSQRYEVVEITHKTIGFDFNPKKPIHHSFMIRHKAGAVMAMQDLVVDNGQKTTLSKPTKTHQHKPLTNNREYQQGNKPKKSLDKFDKKPKNQSFTKEKPTKQAPSKPKVRYEKIDGKMVAVQVIDD